MAMKEEFNEETGVITRHHQKTKFPKKYKVLLHNDDYTTMEFVVFILKKVFFKSEEEAMAIMLKVHQEGVGVCGIYSYEVAESKVHQVGQLAKKEKSPLRCTMSPNDE